jgi:uncharacterized repeat protein (TIGR01451 family)
MFNIRTDNLSYRSHNQFIPLAILIAALSVLAIVPAAQVAYAESPAGCTSVGIGISILESAAKAHHFDTVNYTVILDNEAANRCDVVDAAADFIWPNGTLVELGTGLSIPANTSLTLPVPGTYEIPFGVPPHTETANANMSGIALFSFNQTVTASTNIALLVIHPNITLVKTVSDDKVLVDDTVTYTYNTTNNGDTTLSNVTLVDSELGTIFTGKTLAAGEFNVTTVDVVITTDVTNTATAYGTDQLGLEVNDTDTASVVVINPDIQLVKTVNATKIHSGDTVQYTFNVTNTGTTTLFNVTVVDDLLNFILDPIIGPITLAAGESSIQLVNATITGCGTVTNIATAMGTPQLGNNVTDTDTVTVTVICPDISLDKMVSDDKVLDGATVTYTYNTTNTGDTTLDNVTLVDSELGVIFTGKTLAAGEFNVTTVDVVASANVTNTATAYGTDQLGLEVNDTDTATVIVIHPDIDLTKTCSPDTQLAPGTITWNISVTNTGDTTLTDVNVSDTRHGWLGSFGSLAPGLSGWFTIVEGGLAPGTYTDTANVTADHQLGSVYDEDSAECSVTPTYILKQFTAVTVLDDEPFNASLVSPELIDVIGLHSGPTVFFNVTYYFENSLNYLGDDFDGQAHNFTLWDKWGGNLLVLNSPPVDYNYDTHVVTLADGTHIDIDPKHGNYTDTLPMSLNPTQDEAWISPHTGDQQDGTNPGKGKKNTKDGSSYDADIHWEIGELGVNQSATLTVWVAPGMNPGGQLQFSSEGCKLINTGPRVRAYGDSYANEDFLYAVSRTNQLEVCAFKTSPA